MKIYEFINIISIIVWLVIPLRQLRSRYLLFFLILAIGDPINDLFSYLFEIPPTSTILFLSLCLLIVLLRNYGNKFLWALYIPLLVSSLFSELVLSYPKIRIIIVLIHILILFVFLKDTILNIQEKSEINFFFWMLVFYEITIFAKFIPMITDVTAGVNYFIFMNAVQVLIGIFFLIFTETSKTIRFGFKTQPGGH